MTLREAYNYVASGRFGRFCEQNSIDLKNTAVELKHLNKTLCERESRLCNIESFLMKQIEDLVFSYYILNMKDQLFSEEYCIRIKDTNGLYHELY